MQTENRLLDDLARMANGALNTLAGLREEVENRVRERVERMLADMDMVPREEFDAIKAMAQKARAEQEDLAARVAELERRIAELSGISREAQESRAPTPHAQERPGGLTSRGTAVPPPAALQPQSPFGSVETLLPTAGRMPAGRVKVGADR